MRRFLIFCFVLLAGFTPRLRRPANANLRIAFGPNGPALYLKFLITLTDHIVALLKACSRNPARSAVKCSSIWNP